MCVVVRVYVGVCACGDVEKRYKQRICNKLLQSLHRMRHQTAFCWKPNICTYIHIYRNYYSDIVIIIQVDFAITFAAYSICFVLFYPLELALKIMFVDGCFLSMTRRELPFYLYRRRYPLSLYQPKNKKKVKPSLSFEDRKT